MVKKPWPVWDVAFSPNGRWLAAARGYHDPEWGGEGEVTICGVDGWEHEEGFQAPFTNMACGIAFTVDNKNLIAASNKYLSIKGKAEPRAGKAEPRAGKVDLWAGNEVSLWTVPDGRLIQTMHFDDFHGVADNHGAGYVVGVALSPNGELIALPRLGSVSVVLQRNSGQRVYDVKGDSGTAHSLAFSPDGKTLASLLKSSVQLCDASTGKELASFEPKFENPAHIRWGENGYELVGDRPICVCYSSDGKQIAVGISNGSVLLLTADLTKQLRSLQVSNEKEWVVGIASAPKSDLLAAATPSVVRLFEASSGKQLQEWRKADLRVSAVALSPDGKLLAVGYGGKHDAKGERRGGYVNVWDTATGRLVKKLD